MSREQISYERSQTKGQRSQRQQLPELKGENKSKYLLNTRQSGEGLELLSSLESNSISLVFFDPQYEPVRKVLPTNYPLYSQSDYQILRILEQVERVLKPSAFCLLWVNKTLLGNDRVPLWLLKTPRRYWWPRRKKWSH